MLRLSVCLSRSRAKWVSRIAHWPAKYLRSQHTGKFGTRAAAYTGRSFRPERTQRVHRAAWVSPEPAFRNSTAPRMACQAAHTQTSTHSLTTVAHEVARYNIAMHRVAMLRLSAAACAAKCTERNGTTTWTMHCQSASCVLELWVGYSSSLHGRGQALSARTGLLRVQPLRAQFDLLVGDAAVCMSAADPASTRHLR
jgi:hypothetical protein